MTEECIEKAFDAARSHLPDGHNAILIVIPDVSVARPVDIATDLEEAKLCGALMGLGARITADTQKKKKRREGE